VGAAYRGISIFIHLRIDGWAGQLHNVNADALMLGNAVKQKELVDAVLKSNHTDAMVTYRYRDGGTFRPSLCLEALRGKFTSLCSAISTSATECAAMDKV
jgi:hypothetical protein